MPAGDGVHAVAWGVELHGLAWGSVSALMTVLGSSIDTRSADFRANAEAMGKLTTDLRAQVAETAHGGGESARKKHTARGKLLPRDRVERLLDPGTPFLELGQLAALGMYDGDAPGAGLITGIGRIEGQECMIVANDATVKGGTYYPMTVKKHLRAQEIALENHLPCVYLVDSGGAFLPMQDEVFPDREHFGRIFRNQANDERRGASPRSPPCIGSCTAGGAYVPAMSRRGRSSFKRPGHDLPRRTAAGEAPPPARSSPRRTSAGV